MIANVLKICDLQPGDLAIQPYSHMLALVIEVNRPCGRITWLNVYNGHSELKVYFYTIDAFDVNTCTIIRDWQ